MKAIELLDHRNNLVSKEVEKTYQEVVEFFTASPQDSLTVNSTNRLVVESLRKKLEHEGFIVSVVKISYNDYKMSVAISSEAPTLVTRISVETNMVPAFVGIGIVMTLFSLGFVIPCMHIATLTSNLVGVTVWSTGVLIAMMAAGIVFVRTIDTIARIKGLKRVVISKNSQGEFVDLEKTCNVKQLEGHIGEDKLEVV